MDGKKEMEITEKAEESAGDKFVRRSYERLFFLDQFNKKKITRFKL